MERRSARSVLAAVGCVGVVALTGCGRQQPAPQAATPTGGLTGPQPAGYGVESAPATKQLASITYNLNGAEPATVDPWQAFEGSEAYAASAMCDTLVRLKPGGGEEPGIATSITASADGRRYTVKLRPGVTFWDGKPVTADDVAFGLDYVRSPKNSSYWSSFTANVDSIKAVNPSTVLITLKRPDPIYRELLATPLGAVQEKAFVLRAGSKLGSPSTGVMCSGPYRFSQWRRGDSITLVKNPDWWNRGPGEQFAKRVKLTWVSDTSALDAALLSKQINAGDNLATELLPRLKTASSAGRLRFGPSAFTFEYIPNLRGPLKSLALRQAVSKLIDYNGFLASLNGAGAPTRSLLGPGSWGDPATRPIYDAAYKRLPVLTQDIAAARRLVKQSGVKNPTIVIAADTSATFLKPFGPLADQLRAAGKQVGITFKIKSDFNQFVAASAKAFKGYDLAPTLNYPDVPDPLELYVQIGTKTGFYAAPSGYFDAKVNADLTKAAQTPDAATRARLTVAAQARMTQQLAWIPIAGSYATTWFGSGLTGGPLGEPTRTYNGDWLAQLGASG